VNEFVVEEVRRDKDPKRFVDPKIQREASTEVRSKEVRCVDERGITHCKGLREDATYRHGTLAANVQVPSSMSITCAFIKSASGASSSNKSAELLSALSPLFLSLVCFSLPHHILFMPAEVAGTIRGESRIRVFLRLPVRFHVPSFFVFSTHKIAHEDEGNIVCWTAPSVVVVVVVGGGGVGVAAVVIGDFA